ncbi:MAG TPA: hypothetical protein VNZ63_03280 [Verrucomicrobiae bacterium]|jgi:hypothetical protein|nr:hypothetical protein [Verrucomicrobiae bacterium]
MGDERYCRALLSYIDVLGFADLIERSRTDASGVEAIADLLSKLKARSSAWSRIHRSPQGEPENIFASFDFSDHIVRCSRIAEGAIVSDLFDSELFFLGDLQLAVAEGGALVRGSVTAGEIFFKPGSSLIFGPALVRAYELERDHAVYPRIAIDRLLIDEARMVGGNRSWEDYLLQGEDGLHFLDYLFDWSQTGFAIPGAPDPKPRIKAHRSTIIAAIDRDPRERAMRKLMWIGRYHNSTVQRVVGRFEQRFSGEDTTQYMVPDHLLTY